MLRFRDPKICLNPKCNSKKNIDLYEAVSKDKTYYVPDDKAHKKFTLLVQGEGAERFMQKCIKCIYARPIETEVPLWWVTCHKCKCKTVSDKANICMKCG